MKRISRSSHSNGFTLVEILVVCVILAVLAAIALPIYWRSVEKSRSVEAVVNLKEIRSGELLHEAEHGNFIEALDLPTINSGLNLELSARYFDYAVKQTEASNFLIVATRKQGIPGESLRVTMDKTGKLTYHWPGGSSSGSSGGGSGAGAGGGSGGSISGGSGSGGGTSTSGGGGTTSDGSSTSGGGDSSGGDTTTPPEPPVPPSPPPPPPAPDSFVYIPRGIDLWTQWPDVNIMNITGTEGVEVLTSAFNLVAGSGANSITNDLFRKGISISFIDISTFQSLCGDAIACFGGGYGSPPSEPSTPPSMIFNPTYLNETAEALADVMVHEGTHFQEYLDGRWVNPLYGTVDIEFDAFWNGAVFWGEVRGGISITTALENDAEGLYQLALQGEGPLRDEIVARGY